MKGHEGARLRTSSEFSAVRRDGKALHGKCCVFSYLPRPDSADRRFGVITSRKVGNAVARNRARRRFREILRGILPRLRGGVWIVVVARASAVEAPFSALRDEVLRAAERASILSPSS